MKPLFISLFVFLLACAFYYRINTQPMASKVIKAYYGSGSAPARRMQLALLEKELKFEPKLLSFEKKEHKSPEVLALNPRGKVPVLLDGDIAVYESLAIIEYLEVAYPEHPLLPSDPKGRAETLTRMHESSYFNDNVGSVTRHSQAANKNDEWYAKNEELKGKVFEECKFWDDVLKGKQFITGDKVTLADIAIYPFLDYSVRLGLDFKDYPNLGAFHENFRKRKSAIESYPPHWANSEPPCKSFALPKPEKK